MQSEQGDVSMMLLQLARAHVIPIAGYLCLFRLLINARTTCIGTSAEADT